LKKNRFSVLKEIDLTPNVEHPPVEMYRYKCIYTKIHIKGQHHVFLGGVFNLFLQFLEGFKDKKYGAPLSVVV